MLPLRGHSWTLNKAVNSWYRKAFLSTSEKDLNQNYGKEMNEHQCSDPRVRTVLLVWRNGGRTGWRSAVEMLCNKKFKYNVSLIYLDCWRTEVCGAGEEPAALDARANLSCCPAYYKVFQKKWYFFIILCIPSSLLLVERYVVNIINVNSRLMLVGHFLTTNSSIRGRQNTENFQENRKRLLVLKFCQLS